VTLVLDEVLDVLLDEPLELLELDELDDEMPVNDSNSEAILLVSVGPRTSIDRLVSEDAEMERPEVSALKK
jgi:hypothetical protein